MSFFQNKPWFTAAIVGLFLFGISVFVRIPLFDGVLIYDQQLVHIESDAKIALSYFFGNGLHSEMKNGIVPADFHLKPIGWALVFIVHVGLPILIGLRLKFGKARKEFESQTNE